MITTVFFDFFGVLYPDTLWGLADVFIPKRTDVQKQALRDIVTRSDLGMITREQFWVEASDVYGVSVERALAEKEKIGTVDPRLLERICALKKSGVKTGIISNVGVGFLESALTEEQRRECFDVLVASGSLGFVKPDNRIFEYAAEQLDVQTSECLFFDDVQRNVDGAIAAGMQAHLYEGVSTCDAALRSAGL